VERFEPVDLVITDGIENYRTDFARHKGENKQLMRWCQRTITHVIEQQMELAAIATTTCVVAHCSHLHPITRIAGVRCHLITKREVEKLQKYSSFWMREVLERFEIDPKAVYPGALVPTETGETLATLTPDGTLTFMSAEVAAAQNDVIQYCEGHPTPFSFPTHLMKDGMRLANFSDKKRLASAFNAKAVLFQPNGVDGAFEEFKRFKTLNQAKKFLGIEKVKGDKKTLFRDVSGLYFSPGLWVTGREFWDRVAEVVGDRLRHRLAAHVM
jgi:hypothetical protein